MGRRTTRRWYWWNCYKRWSRSNRSSGWNDSTLWDYDNPVADVIIFAIDIGWFAFGRYYDPVSDPGIFVDNGAFDNAMSSDAQWGTV